MPPLPQEQTLPLPVTALLCALLLLLTACGAANREPVAGSLELRILHVNDTHAFLAGTDAHMNACFEATDCRGGLARVSAAIRAARHEQDNVIALDAGDQFQGTLFYSVNKWPMIAAADALLPYDAMTLGNHEFDEGCRELARFLEVQPLPVLAANLAPQQGCPLAGSRIRPYLVQTIRGTRVGIIGLANDDVTALAAACPQTTFRDARTTLQHYVAELEAQGIRHIIAVTHLGLERDKELARSVNGVDVIVGGHSHTYLGPGSTEGPYPIVEHAPDGAPVLVVTAARATRYLGDLSITFDAAGIPAAWTGGPRELVPALPQEEAMTRLVANYAETLVRYRTEIVGRHNVKMPDGMEACRKGDCFSGLLTADAFLEYGRKQGARLALVNGGGIRAALAASLAPCQREVADALLALEIPSLTETIIATACLSCEQMDSLWSSGGLEVRRALLGQQHFIQHLDTGQVRDILKADDVPMLRQLALCMREEVQPLLPETDPLLDRLWRHLRQHPDMRVREALACNPHISPDYAFSVGERFRQDLPFCTTAFSRLQQSELGLLFKAAHTLLLQLIGEIGGIEKPGVRKNVIRYLARHPDPLVRQALAGRGGTDLCLSEDKRLFHAVLMDLCEDTDLRVCAAARERLLLWEQRTPPA